MILWMKLGGIFAGVLARTFVPYLRKVKEGKVQGFSGKYAASSIASLILGVIVTILIFPQFSMLEGAGQIGLEASIKFFCTAFGFGFGWNAIINEAGKWSGAFK